MANRAENPVITGEGVTSIPVTVVQFDRPARVKSSFSAPTPEQLRIHPRETERNLQLQADLLGTLPAMINDDFSVERRWEIADYLGVPYWRVDKAQQRLRRKNILYIREGKVEAMMNSEREKTPFYVQTEPIALVRHIFPTSRYSTVVSTYAADE